MSYRWYIPLTSFGFHILHELLASVRADVTGVSEWTTRTPGVLGVVDRRMERPCFDASDDGRQPLWDDLVEEYVVETEWVPTDGFYE